MIDRPERQRLAQSISAAGQMVVPLDFSDGTSLVVLPFGARVLGLYASNHDTNFLWTNPALESADGDGIDPDQT